MDEERDETATAPYNYSKTNWEEFTCKLGGRLPRIRNIKTKSEIDTLTQELIISITQAVETAHLENVHHHIAKVNLANQEVPGQQSISNCHSHPG